MAKITGFGKRLGGGYSAQLAKDLLSDANLVAVGAGLVPHYVWDDESSQYTDELASYSLAVSAEELEPFDVKLPSSVTFDGDFLSRVAFDGLEACQVRGSVYFRARDVKAVK